MSVLRQLHVGDILVLGFLLGYLMYRAYERYRSRRSQRHDSN